MIGIGFIGRESYLTAFLQGPAGGHAEALAGDTNTHTHTHTHMYTMYNGTVCLIGTVYLPA